MPNDLEMASDLDIKGAQLLKDTGGDISKATPDVKIAADVFFNSMESMTNKARSAKGKDRELLFNQLESYIRANPHLVPFYDSWKTLREIDEMGKALDK